MAWIWLTLAGLLEIVWAIGLKYTDGFTRLVPSAVTLVAMIVSMYFLALAVRTIPIGTGYAVWTGIGAVGVAILGIILFDEPKDLIRVGSILLIVGGIAGLKLTSNVRLSLSCSAIRARMRMRRASSPSASAARWARRSPTSTWSALATASWSAFRAGRIRTACWTSCFP